MGLRFVVGFNNLFPITLKVAQQKVWLSGGSECCGRVCVSCRRAYTLAQRVSGFHYGGRIPNSSTPKLATRSGGSVSASTGLKP